MPEVVRVFRVTELPADLEPLAAEASREGFAFLQRLLDEWRSQDNRFDRPGEALFVARVGSLLVGICGLNRDPYADVSGVGRVRRLYVSTRLRRQGVARALTSEVLEAAREGFTRLRLRTDSPEAAEFYESIGFAPIVDRNATHELGLGGSRGCRP